MRKKNSQWMILLFIVVLCLSSCSIPNKKYYPEVSSLIIAEENLFRNAAEEISKLKEEYPQIWYISSTEKQTIYEPAQDFSHIEGLYIRLFSEEVYRSLDNPVLERVLQLEGVKQISISGDYFSIFLGSEGNVTLSIHCGFYYTDLKEGEEVYINRKIELSGGEMKEKGRGWEWVHPTRGQRAYVEKIIDNFYYCEYAY
jgi:hypothetical protein